MGQYLTGSFFAITDIGKVRSNNEDFADKRINAFGNVLLLVCDGMGGANKGDYASSYIGKYLCKGFVSMEDEFKSEKQFEKWLYKNINEANKHIYKKSVSSEEFQGMGTTLSVAIIMKNKLITAQVGDSRIYRLADKKLEQLSVDQTYVEHLKNQKEISQSDIASHPDRHKLTNAIGVRKVALVDLKSFDYNNETLFLCSDGLYNNVSQSDIASVLKSKDSVERKGKQLIAFGNTNGGSDNMAIVIWEK